MLLESPHRGDSNEYTQNTIFSIKKENHSNFFPNLQPWYIFQGTQERVRNTQGKRAIWVRAIEDLRYVLADIGDTRAPLPYRIYGVLGPVVQNIVSSTKSLVEELLNFAVLTKSTAAIFWLKDCKVPHIFLAKDGLFAYRYV